MILCIRGEKKIEKILMTLVIKREQLEFEIYKYEDIVLKHLLRPATSFKLIDAYIVICETIEVNINKCMIRVINFLDYNYFRIYLFNLVLQQMWFSHINCVILYIHTQFIKQLIIEGMSMNNMRCQLFNSYKMNHLSQNRSRLDNI